VIRRQQVIDIDHQMLKVNLLAGLVGEICPHRLESRIVIALINQYAEHGQVTRAALMHQVHLHWEMPTFYCVLTRCVKMVLLELVAHFAELQIAALIVVNLNGVTIINHVSNMLLPDDF